MKILYISVLSSDKVINRIYEETGVNPGFAVQKFSRLLVKGLVENNADVVAFSNPPITRAISTKLFISMGGETENGVSYKYIPFINFPMLKHICILLYSFFYVFFWGLKDRKNKAVICDILSVSACMGALFATKINGLQSVSVVTDIYGQMTGVKKSGITALISSLASCISNWYSTSFDKYILLTEQMNDIVNPKRRPYMVMEALCDNTFAINNIQKVEKDNPRVVMYAGGLYEKYGLKMLVDGFIASKVDAKLVLYGDGSYVDELKEVCKNHPNVEYRGIAANEEIVEQELKATLLVNPRFTTEEFAKYSFPSKNMEYMVSGTPLLTTKLPGMPKEYYPYVYMFEEESVEGYAAVIRTVLSRSSDELSAMGRKAAEFVLKNKNNISQGARIVKFLCDDVI